MFVSFEGVDASGKSTVIAVSAASLRELGYDVVVVQQPSNSAAGAAFRAALVLEHRDPLVEFAYLIADRTLAVTEVIGPALASGSVVLADRYFHSHVYQAVEGLALRQMIAANRTLFPIPDVTYWLDVDVEVALERAERRGDKIGLERAAAIRSAYVDLWNDGQMTRLDGGKPTAELSALIVGHIRDRL